MFLYAFAKSDRDNIDDDELEALRTIGANWLAAPAELVVGFWRAVAKVAAKRGREFRWTMETE